MYKIDDDHQTLPLPKIRRFLVDTIELGSQKHLIHGLLEADVTDTRRRLQQWRDETGTTPSFTGFIVACVGKAVDENKIMHAYHGSRDKLVLFSDVDIATIVEVEAGGRKFPVGHIIRAANRRSLWDIHEEIRRVQAKRELEDDAAPGGSLMLNLPGFLRRFLYRASVRNPQAMKTRAGTVLVTSVGMFGAGAGWGIPISFHTLTVTVGGIVQRPGVKDGQIDIGEFLSVTISCDHDIVDGAPAARFAHRLKELVEEGYGLHEEPRG